MSVSPGAVPTHSSSAVPTSRGDLLRRSSMMTGWISVERPARPTKDRSGSPKLLERTVSRICLAQVVETPIPDRQGVGPRVVG